MKRFIDVRSLFERAAVAFLLFSVSGVTEFARSAVTWQSPVMPVTLGTMGVLISWFYRVRISHKFIMFLLVYYIIAALQSVIYMSVHLKYLTLYPLNFWVAYCFVKAMKKRFLSHVEMLTALLAGASLVLWTIDVLTGRALRNLMSGISLGAPYDPIVNSYIYFETFINEGVASVIPRNSGFAWEPGAFAVLCCMGLVLNFYRTRFRLVRNYRAFVLIAAVISSQSTTGYVILLAILMLKLWNDLPHVGRIIVFPGLAAVIVAATISLPFMREKVEHLWVENLTELNRTASGDWNRDHPVAAQRFLSFKIDFGDFLNNPVTGYGGEESQMLVKRESYNIVTVSGIGKVLARFGVVGFAFFIISTALSSISISRQFGTNSPAMLFVCIIATSFSYSVIEQPLFLALWCYRFFGGYAGKRLQRRGGVMA